MDMALEEQARAQRLEVYILQKRAEAVEYYLNQHRAGFAAVHPVTAPAVAPTLLPAPVIQLPPRAFVLTVANPMSPQAQPQPAIGVYSYFP
jgi:hypothetical protein